MGSAYYPVKCEQHSSIATEVSDEIQQYIKSNGTASKTSRLISTEDIEEGEQIFKSTDLILKVCSPFEDLHFRKSN